MFSSASKSSVGITKIVHSKHLIFSMSAVVIQQVFAVLSTVFLIWLGNDLVSGAGGILDLALFLVACTIGSYVPELMSDIFLDKAKNVAVHNYIEKFTERYYCVPALLKAEFALNAGTSVEGGSKREVVDPGASLSEQTREITDKYFDLTRQTVRNCLNVVGNITVMAVFVNPFLAIGVSGPIVVLGLLGIGNKLLRNRLNMASQERQNRREALNKVMSDGWDNIALGNFYNFNKWRTVFEDKFGLYENSSANHLFITKVVHFTVALLASSPLIAISFWQIAVTPATNPEELLKLAIILPRQMQILMQIRDLSDCLSSWPGTLERLKSLRDKLDSSEELNDQQGLERRITWEKMAFVINNIPREVSSMADLRKIIHVPQHPPASVQTPGGILRRTQSAGALSTTLQRLRSIKAKDEWEEPLLAAKNKQGPLSVPELSEDLQPIAGRITIRGENGAGKTTLISLLKSELDGSNIKKVKLCLREGGFKKIGSEGKHRKLFDEVIYCPNGLGDVYFDTKKTKSTGERQRESLKEIFRFLNSEKSKDVRYLLLDEWDANLDESKKKTISATLDELAKRIWVIEIRHTEPSESVHKTVSKDSVSGLKYQPVRGDGHCLFVAVSIHVGQDQELLRRIVATHIEHNIEQYRDVIQALNPEKTPEGYLQDLRQCIEWADNLEIAVLMKVLDRPIVVVESDGKVRNLSDLTGNGDHIFVQYNGHNHYDALVLTGEKNCREIFAALTQLTEHSQPNLTTRAATFPTRTSASLSEAAVAAAVGVEAGSARSPLPSPALFLSSRGTTLQPSLSISAPPLRTMDSEAIVNNGWS